MIFNEVEFLNPPKKYRPLIRWWWPGLAVNKSEITHELNLLDSAGFGGVEIQPFLIGGSDGKPDDETHRMAPNPYYYEILLHLLKEAHSHNFIVDLTFGSSWPPGGTQIDKSNNLKTILVGTKFVKGEKENIIKHQISIPPIQLNMYYKYRKLMNSFIGGVQNNFDNYFMDFKPIATIAVKPKGRKKSDKLNFIFPKQTALDFSTTIDISDKVDKEGKISWKVPQGIWQIFCFYGGPTGMHPMSEAKSSQTEISHSLDILNRYSVKILADSLVGVEDLEYKSKIQPYLGTTLRAFFTDSQEIANEWFWTNTFFDNFEKKRGYDVKPYLPCCFVPNRDNQFIEVVFQNEKPCFEFHKDKIGKRIRHDWLVTLTELWNEEFIKYISQWGKEYNIKHRIQTYGMPIDVLKTFGSCDIPETETLFAGSIDFFKLASSAALLYKKSIVSSETFSWFKRDGTLTPLKWKFACDRSFISGINQHIYHGWTYFERDIEIEKLKDKYPGHYPWAGHGFSENLSEASAFWQYYPKINNYVTRMQYLLQISVSGPNIGIFSQMWNYSFKNLSGESLEDGYLEGFDSKRPHGPISWFKHRIRSKQDKKCHLQQIIGHQLMEYGYDYCHINEDAIINCNIEDGFITVGSAKLNTIILPKLSYISSEVLEKLKKCTQSNIKIIFWGYDKIEKIRNSGYYNYQNKDLIIKRIIKSFQTDQMYKKNVIFQNIPKNWDVNIHNNINIGKLIKEVLNITPLVKYETPQKDLFLTKRNMGGKTKLLMFLNSQNNNRIINFNSNWIDSHINIYEIDAWEGKLISIRDDLATLDFSPYESRLFMFTEKFYPDSKIASPPLKSSLIKESDIILDKWSFNVNIREDNGNYFDFEIENFELKDWRNVKELKFCSGIGKYTSSFDITLDLNQKFKEKKKFAVLNLGKVHGIAKILLNKKEIKSIFFPPYKLELNDFNNYLKDGKNILEIETTGNIQNRLIGYGKRNAKKGDNPWKKYKNRNLFPMGIIGPVKIEIFNKNDY